jgi:hypothetical protein
MSFIAGMITSLKNNKRYRISTFDKIKNFKKGKEKKLHFKKKSSSKQLIEIRIKLQKENKEKLIKNSIIISIFLGVIIYFIGYYKF